MALSVEGYIRGSAVAQQERREVVMSDNHPAELSGLLWRALGLPMPEEPGWLPDPQDLN